MRKSRQSMRIMSRSRIHVRNMLQTRDNFPLANQRYCSVYQMWFLSSYQMLQSEENLP